MFKDYIIESNNKDGPIMTLTLFINNMKKISLDSENNVLNEKGEIVYIAHQYDRSLNLTKIISNKYNETIKKPKEKKNNTYYYILFLIAFLIIFMIAYFFFKTLKIKSKKSKKMKRKGKHSKKRKIFDVFLKKKENIFKESDEIPIND